MSTYVDTSTLIKLLIEEPGTDRATHIWSSANHVVAVSLIEVEARAALAAATRAGRVTAAQHGTAKAALVELLDQMDVVEVTADLVTTAGQIAEQEGLRGYDAVHLAAAVFVGADVLTSADASLCAAGDRQGMAIANPIPTT